MADKSAKLENPEEGTRQARKGRSRFIALARALRGAQSPPHGRGPTWTKRVLCQIGRWMLRLRYRVRMEGLQAIKEKGRNGILFLPNHPALIDPPIVVTYLYQHFAVRPLAAAGAINQPLVRSLAKMIDVISLPETSEIGSDSADRVQRVITLCVEALRRGDNILLYPSGQLMREQNTNMGSASAVDRIVAESPEVRLVLMRTTDFMGE